MARPKVELESPGVQELLTDPGVAEHLRGLAERVLAAAQAGAPVMTGAYRDSLWAWTDETDRAVAGVGTDVDYGLEVEAATGILARSLDAARGA